MINLLPLGEQKNLMAAEFHRIIFFFGSMAIGLSCIVGGLLLPTYIPLMLTVRDREEVLLFEQRAARELEVSDTAQHLRRVSELVESLRGIFQDNARTSSLVDSFFTAAGSLSLETIIIKPDGTVNMSGRATTRRDLLDFEKTLRELNLFQDVLFPLTNIVQQRDIHFSVQAHLKEGLK